MATTDLIFRLIGKDQTSPAFRSAAGSADALDRKVKDVDGSMGKLSKWGKAGALALGTGFIVGGVAAAKFGVAAATAASDFAEVGAALDQTFGKAAANDLQTWASTSAKALGQSKTQALDAAKTFGIFGKAAGLTEGELVGFSTELTTLATDLASFNNTSPEEAIEALGAGLRGESEPLRQYGVLLDDATLKARAMTMGIFDGTGSLTQQQRVLAAQAEILAQTSIQQGDFTRTQGGMANQLRQTTAQWENIKIAAGAALVPIAETYLPRINEGMGEFAGAIERNIPLMTQRVGEFAEKVEATWPIAEGHLRDVAATVQDNWPEIVATAKTLGESLENVGTIAKTMFDAFRSLPPELQTFIGTVALLQKTGVLAISFKAADIVKDLFASKVPVMNVGVLNAGAGGALAGAAGKTSATATAGAAVAKWGPAAGAIAAIAGATYVVDQSTESLSKSATAANVYSSAMENAAKSAGGTATEVNKASGAAATATGMFSAAGGASMRLAAEVNKAGSAAGLTADQVDVMTAAAMAVPAGASVPQLTQAIADAGKAAGMTQPEIDAMTAAAYAIPGQANVPALTQAIAVAGQAAGLSQSQIDAMSTAVRNVPPGATAEQMGEAIRVAGVKAGLTDQQIQGVTAAARNVPANTQANVNTNAPAETVKINALQTAINSLEGKTVNVGVSLSGSTGGGGSATFSGSTSGVGGWIDDQVKTLAKELAPTLAGVAGGAYAGPGGGVLGRPLSSYVVSSEYGPRNGTMHYGIDLAAPMGQSVFSSAPGLITQSGWNGGYGNFIAIDHGLGIMTRYGHMSALLAGAGQVVGQGNPIGAVGSTGDSTGPHLHFETMVGGNFVNPRTMVALRHGGLVPLRVSNGEFAVSPDKAAKNLPLLHALNSGAISGPGSGTSDSIYAAGRPGTFVVNAKSAAKHRAMLGRIMRGSQSLAGGGVVGGGGGYVVGGGRVQLLIDGRILHESLIRYQRESGTADLFPVRA